MNITELTLRDDCQKATLNGLPVLVRVCRLTSQAYIILPQERVVEADGSFTYHTPVLSATKAHYLGHRLELLK